MLGFSHPIRKKIKTSHPHNGDRFIPDRPTSEDIDVFTSDRTPLRASPFANYLYSSLFDMTPTALFNRRLFSYTGLSRKQHLNTSSLFSPKDVEITTDAPSRKAWLQQTKILDAPGIPLDFYLNLLSFSTAGRMMTAVESEDEPNSFQIASVFTTQGLKDKQLVLFDPIQKTPSAVAALGDDGVISGWSDGILRKYLFDGNTAPSQQLYITRYAKINALVVSSPHTCLSGTARGDLGLVDFRTPHAINAGTNVNEQPEAHEQIAGLAFNGEHYVATGANDNKVKVWDLRYLDAPLFTNHSHSAAVKALAFDPLSKNHLISGGGSACCCLYSSNIMTLTTRLLVNTGAQVTGVHWFQDDPRYLVTGHGYNQSAVKLWHRKNDAFTLTYDSKILTNETNRILYLAGSPSNNDIAVVDSNECIRFFKPIGLKSSVKNNASNERYPTMLPGGPTIR